MKLAAICLEVSNRHYIIPKGEMLTGNVNRRYSSNIDLTMEPCIPGKMVGGIPDMIGCLDGAGSCGSSFGGDVVDTVYSMNWYSLETTLNARDITAKQNHINQVPGALGMDRGALLSGALF